MDHIIPDEIEVNGVAYVRMDSLITQILSGNRAVVVLQRNQIFAGDLAEKEGRVHLDNPIQVIDWYVDDLTKLIESNGRGDSFRKLPFRLSFPLEAELLRIPVHATWGLG